MILKTTACFTSRRNIQEGLSSPCTPLHSAACFFLFPNNSYEQGQNNTQGQNKKAKNSAQKQSAQSKNQCNEKSRQSHCSVCYKISYGKGSLRKIFRTERRTTAKLRTRHRSPLRCTLTSVHLHLCVLPSFKLFFRIILSFFPIVKCFLCFFYIPLTFMQKREKQLLSLSFFVKLHGFFSVSQRKG